MATVAPESPARTKFDARVEAEIGKAVGRIRANDLLLGGLAAATLVLAYTVGMVLLDRWLVLPMPVRQATLGGFLLALGLVGYLFVVRPLRRAVNPRYAARRVEETVADSKNAVINWVDLQDRDLPATVRTAVGQRAAGDFQSADVAKATEAKAVVWLGAAAGLLAATLAILFVALKPAPFTSLVKRTFNPFVFREIASRTTLTLTEPAGGDVTVTAGESMTVAVDVGGSVPATDGPTRLRLQVWHTDGQAEVDELPLEPGQGNDWRLTVPPNVIQNGFQYRVVGGDSRTADHRVTVRTRPLVIGFEARYTSPAYTRIPVEVGREPKLEGYRGTKVTLVARTNRPLKRGWMKLDNRPEPIPAAVVGDNRDALQFDLTLAEGDSYRLGFTSAADETSEPTPPYPVKVLTDQPPTLTINTPPAPGDGKAPKADPDTITLPANGLLTVDGEAADDFGLTAVVLRMQVVAPNKLTLQPRPYREGKFKRADGTYPTRLANGDGSQTGYKAMVELASLLDLSGQPLPAAAETVIEYWLEATDNCTEPRPNVGTSARKTLRLTPAVKDEQKKQEIGNQAAARKTEQENHEKAQDKQLEGEKREPKQLRPDPDKPPQEDQPQEGQPQEGGPPKQGNNGQPPKKGEQTQPADTSQPGATPDGSKPPKEQQPEKKPNEQSGDPKGSVGEPKTADGGKPGEPKGTPEKQPKGGKSSEQPGAKSEASPDHKELDKKADKVQQAIRENGEPGTGARPEAPQPRPAGEQQPSAGGQPSPSDATAKEQEKQKQQAIDDLASDDPAKKQAAREKLDQTVGPKERERIEQLQKDLDSPDPETRKKAEKELGELDRETGTSGAGVRNNRPEDVERLSRELNSDNPTTKKNAERRAERDFGSQGRQDLQKAGEKLKSPDQQKQDEGKKDVDKLMKKDKKKKEEQKAGGEQQPKNGEPSKADQVRQQANDLTSSDPDKKQAAEQAMDRQMGEPARKDLQQKLGSKDEKQQQAGKQQVEQMAKQAGEAGQKPSPEQVKEMADAARDLNSTDDAKRQAAEQKLDQKLGESGRKQLQQDLKDLQSGDDAKRQAAEQKLKDAAEKTAGGKADPKPADQPKGPTKEDIEKVAEAARDLTSPDPAKRKAAEDKLDAQVGKERREQIQKNLDDLKNGTPEQQAAAAKNLEQMAKDAAEKAGQKPPTPEQAKELADAAKDLNSTDPAKKQAAEQKLDQAIGKPAREQLQKEQAAKQPDPKAARDATEKAMAGDKGPKPDPAETERKMKELADTAKDLTSPDEAKKQAAEKKLDDQIGEEARKQAQQLAEDLKSQDEKTRQDAKRKLDQLCADCLKKSDRGGKGQGRSPQNAGQKYEDDINNRLKAAELQLKTFEKNRGNKAVLEKLGYTEEEFNRFMEDYAKRVEQLRAEATKPKNAQPPKAADGPPTVTVAEGAGQREKKETGVTTGGAGGGTAAPGYTDAQKRFAAQAAKGGKKPAEAPKQP